MMTKKITIKSSQRGFTLLEMMVVLVIIATIAGTLAVNIMGRQDQANVKLAKAGAVKLEGYVSQFRSDTKRFPNSFSELTERPGDVKSWYGPYATASELEDPWGSEYQLKVPGEHGRVDVFSFGADGKEGGQDLDADIGNWD